MAARRRLPANVERVDRGSNGTGYRARVQLCGKNIRGRIHRSVGDAVQDARKLATQVTRHGGPDTISEAFDAILRVCEDADRRPATVEFYEENRRVIEAHFGASKRIHSIRVEDVQEWVREMRRRGNQPGTLRARLRALRRVFRIAGRESVRLDQLVIPDVQEPDPRSFLELSDVRALLAKLGPDDVEDPPDSFWMVGFLMLTGARRAEVARMRKDDMQTRRHRVLRQPCTGARGATPHGSWNAAARRGAGPPQELGAQGVNGCSRRAAEVRLRLQRCRPRVDP